MLMAFLVMSTVKLTDGQTDQEIGLFITLSIKCNSKSVGFCENRINSSIISCMTRALP